MIITCRSTGMGWYWGCFNTSTTRAPRASCFCVAWSSSEPNCANASSSRYCARSSRSRPATLRIAFVCAEAPTRETEMPTLTAGRTPEKKRSDCRKIWPSVIEMTFVGMYAATSPACVAQPLVDPGDGGRLLPDRDVDAVHVGVALVEDRVDEDRRLARRAVADDQLALATADVRHRVDRLDPGRERLLHGLARDDAGRLELERPELVRLDRPATVERIAERVDDAAEQALADGNARDLARAPHRL